MSFEFFWVGGGHEKFGRGNITTETPLFRRPSLSALWLHLCEDKKGTRLSGKPCLTWKGFLTEMHPNMPHGFERCIQTQLTDMPCEKCVLPFDCYAKYISGSQSVVTPPNPAQGSYIYTHQSWGWTESLCCKKTILLFDCYSKIHFQSSKSKWGSEFWILLYI